MKNFIISKLFLWLLMASPLLLASDVDMSGKKPGLYCSKRSFDEAITSSIDLDESDIACDKGCDVEDDSFYTTDIFEDEVKSEDTRNTYDVMQHELAQKNKIRHGLLQGRLCVDVENIVKQNYIGLHRNFWEKIAYKTFKLERCGSFARNHHRSLKRVTDDIVVYKSALEVYTPKYLDFINYKTGELIVRISGNFDYLCKITGSEILLSNVSGLYVYDLAKKSFVRNINCNMFSCKAKIIGNKLLIGGFVRTQNSYKAQCAFLVIDLKTFVVHKRFVVSSVSSFDFFDDGKALIDFSNGQLAVTDVIVQGDKISYKYYDLRLFSEVGEVWSSIIAFSDNSIIICTFSDYKIYKNIDDMNQVCSGKFNSTITAVTSCLDGRIIFGTNDGNIAVLDFENKDVPIVQVYKVGKTEVYNVLGFCDGDILFNCKKSKLLKLNFNGLKNALHKLSLSDVMIAFRYLKSVDEKDQKRVVRGLIKGFASVKKLLQSEKSDFLKDGNLGELCDFDESARYKKRRRK